MPSILKDDPSLQPVVVDAFTKHTAVKDPRVYQTLNLPWVEPSGRLNAASMETLQDYYIATGVQSQRVDLSKVIDQTFVQNAVKQLGKV
jgi:NitT/TauT family transport system substrate-binding protein